MIITNGALITVNIHLTCKGCWFQDNQFFDFHISDTHRAFVNSNIQVNGVSIVNVQHIASVQ